MSFSEIFEPRVGDHDDFGRLTFEAVLEMLENVSVHHCAAVNDNLADRGVSWVLLDWRIRILRQPEPFQRLLVETRVADHPSCSTTFRDYTVTGDNNETLIKAAARFTLADVRRGKTVRISRELLESYLPEELPGIDGELPRLREPEFFDEERSIALRRSDLDFNGHVHNTRYIEFAMETLPEEEYERMDFTDLRIAFRSGATGSRITVKRTAAEQGVFFCLYSEGRLCAMAELK